MIELTDAEIDTLLERFDQTAPELQRKIVAQFAAEAVASRDTIATLLKALVEARKEINARRMVAANVDDGLSPELLRLQRLFSQIDKAINYATKQGK